MQNTNLLYKIIFKKLFPSRNGFCVGLYIIKPLYHKAVVTVLNSSNKNSSLFRKNALRTKKRVTRVLRSASLWCGIYLGDQPYPTHKSVKARRFSISFEFSEICLLCVDISKWLIKITCHLFLSIFLISARLSKIEVQENNVTCYSINDTSFNQTRLVFLWNVPYCL